MEIKTGYLYHIKDEFFLKYNDNNLMQNHELGRTRPTYFAIRDEDILWFIPISSKILKYQKIIVKKIKKYGICDTILIREILGRKHAILLQNAFPTIEKYISHVHMVDNSLVKVNSDLRIEVTKRFKKMIQMKQKGIDLFFVDIDTLKVKLLQEELVNS